MKIKNLIIAFLLALTLAPFMSVKAQTDNASFVTYEGRGGVSVLFSRLHGSTDVDSTTWVDWTPINAALTTAEYWAQPTDSLGANVTDTVIVYVMGTANTGSTPLTLDTVTVIGGQVGTLSIATYTVAPPYISFRATSTATAAKKYRKLIFRIDAPYNTGVSPADIRQRVFDGKYGTGR